MTNQLTFVDIKVTTRQFCAERALTVDDVTRCLYQIHDTDATAFKSARRAVLRIYQKNAGEFSETMSGKIRLATGGQLVRVFSLRGAYLLAMFSKATQAKKFRRWVLDIFDSRNAWPAKSQFTDEELLDLCSTLNASDRMLRKIRMVEPILTVAEHRLAGAFASMPGEYSRTLRKARRLVERETQHINCDDSTRPEIQQLNLLRSNCGVVL